MSRQIGVRAKKIFHVPLRHDAAASISVVSEPPTEPARRIARHAGFIHAGSNLESTTQIGAVWDRLGRFKRTITEARTIYGDQLRPCPSDYRVASPDQRNVEIADVRLLANETPRAAIPTLLAPSIRRSRRQRIKTQRDGQIRPAALSLRGTSPPSPRPCSGSALDLRCARARNRRTRT